jgi:hypothetical protein
MMMIISELYLHELTPTHAYFNPNILHQFSWHHFTFTAISVPSVLAVWGEAPGRLNAHIVGSNPA